METSTRSGPSYDQLPENIIIAYGLFSSDNRHRGDNLLETITFAINDDRITVPVGTTILKAADRYGIDIPRLCHHNSLKPSGACRLCIVEDMKTSRVISSCTTPAASGMEISTNSDRIISHRRNIIRLLMSEHPESCLVCGKGNRCELRTIAAQLNVGEIKLNPLSKFRKTERVNPFISRDLNKCILCGRCIRACNELVGAGVLDYSGRGFDARPATLSDTSYLESTCIFCGTCAGICPTGALLPTPDMSISTPEKESVSVCGFCSAGCRLTVGSASSTITSIDPAHDPDSINGSTLCVRGHYAHDFLNSEDRLTSPMVKKDGMLTPVSWDEAIDYTTSRLMAIKTDYGPESMGFYGSSKCSCEENYLFRKLSATLFKTNNIDNGSSLRGNGFLNGILQPFTNHFRAGKASDIETADTVLVFGSDVETTVPMLDFSIKRALASGTRVIHFGENEHYYASKNAVSRGIAPLSEIHLLSGIIKAVAEKPDVEKSAFRIKNAKAFFNWVKTLDKGLISERTGLEPDVFASTAGALVNRNTVCVMGSEFISHVDGEQIAGMLMNLSNLMMPETRHSLNCCFAFLENNTIGSRLMGTLPTTLPGGAPLTPSTLSTWEAHWETKLSSTKGLTIGEMLEKAKSKDLKSLYIMGENLVRSLGRNNSLVKNLSNVEFIVVQDILDNETCSIADVVLPGAAPFEKSGSFINLEGRQQFFHQIVPPPGEARPDLEILNFMETRIKNQAPGKTLYADITKEMEAFIPFYGPPGTLLITCAVNDRAAPCFCLPQETADAPLVNLSAITLPSRYHLGCGTRTGHSRRIMGIDGLEKPLVF